MNYIEKYLTNLIPGKWYRINGTPPGIGYAGISQAVAAQILEAIKIKIELDYYGYMFRIIPWPEKKNQPIILKTANKIIKTCKRRFKLTNKYKVTIN